jgi:hypothetical protein
LRLVKRWLSSYVSRDGGNELAPEYTKRYSKPQNVE